MTKVKFEVEIDSSKPSHTEALNSFLKVVGGQGKEETPVAEETSKTEPEEEKPAKKTREPRRTKAEIEAEKAAKEEAETPKEEPQESDEQRLIAVRALLSKTIQEGGDEARDKCVEKLQEMDAKNPDTGKYNISSLDPSKYDEFTEFLNSL